MGVKIRESTRQRVVCAHGLERAAQGEILRGRIKPLQRRLPPSSRVKLKWADRVEKRSP